MHIHAILLTGACSLVIATNPVNIVSFSNETISANMTARVLSVDVHSVVTFDVTTKADPNIDLLYCLDGNRNITQQAKKAVAVRHPE